MGVSWGRSVSKVLIEWVITLNIIVPATSRVAVKLSSSNPCYSDNSRKRETKIITSSMFNVTMNRTQICNKEPTDIFVIFFFVLRWSFEQITPQQTNNNRTKRIRSAVSWWRYEKTFLKLWQKPWDLLNVFLQPILQRKLQFRYYTCQTTYLVTCKSRDRHKKKSVIFLAIKTSLRQKTVIHGNAAKSQIRDPYLV